MQKVKHRIFILWGFILLIVAGGLYWALGGIQASEIRPITSYPTPTTPMVPTSSPSGTCVPGTKPEIKEWKTIEGRTSLSAGTFVRVPGTVKVNAYYMKKTCEGGMPAYLRELFGTYMATANSNTSIKDGGLFKITLPVGLYMYEWSASHQYPGSPGLPAGCYKDGPLKIYDLNIVGFFPFYLDLSGSKC